MAATAEAAEEAWVAKALQLEDVQMVGAQAMVLQDVLLASVGGMAWLLDVVAASVDMAALQLDAADTDVEWGVENQKPAEVAKDVEGLQEVAADVEDTSDTEARGMAGRGVI